MAGLDNVTIEEGEFLSVTLGTSRFDLIVFVASLHHLPLRPALRRARALLRPGGALAVVGLAANAAPWDWVCSAVQLPAVRLGSWAHREVRDVPVVTAAPTDSLRAIRAVVAEELPGATLRRALYCRYLLRWTAPGQP